MPDSTRSNLRWQAHSTADWCVAGPAASPARLLHCSLLLATRRAAPSLTCWLIQPGRHPLLVAYFDPRSEGRPSRRVPPACRVCSFRRSPVILHPLRASPPLLRLVGLRNRLASSQRVCPSSRRARLLASSLFDPLRESIGHSALLDADLIPQHACWPSHSRRHPSHA